MHKNESGFGTASYQGYEYQIHVTVWLALKLIVESGNTDMILVEPVTGEDVSVDLDVDPDKSMSNLEIPLSKGHLEVQIKRKTTGAWSVGDIVKMVRGEGADPFDSKMRTWPIVSLINRTDYRFVLITNTTVPQNLKSHILDDVNSLSNARTLHTSFSKGTSLQNPELIASRIGILELQETALIDYRIREIVHRKAYVPFRNIEQCISELKKQVRERLLGIHSREWNRKEIEATLRKYEGFPNKPEEVVNFVAPSNYQEMVNALEQNYALLLSGPPGVGKTIAANNLMYSHQVSDPPFTVITETSTPAQIGRLIQQPGRYLFYLTDPWGQSQLEESAARWTSELPKLLKHASEDKRFLITTRTAIQKEAKAEHFHFTSITINLLPQNYQTSERLKMLWLHAGEINSSEKDFLRVHQNEIVKSLLVPLSISEFIHRLKRSNITGAKKPLKRMLEQSNVDAISRTVQQELSGLEWEAKPGAIVLWSLFAVDRSPTESLLQLFANAVEGTDSSLKLQIRKLINWMIEAYWLRKEASRYNSHPTVMTGLEMIVADEPDLTMSVTSALLKGLFSVDRKLTFDLLKYFKGRVEDVPINVLEGINLYLRSAVLEADDENFGKTLNELSIWSTDTKDPVVLLGKAVYHMRDHGMGLKRWEIPKLSEEEVRLISYSEEARHVMSKFIALLLPQSHVLYETSFLSFLKILGWEMAEAFMRGVPSLLVEPSLQDKLVVTGALSGPQPPYEEILNIALTELRAAEQWFDKFKDLKREAEQAELDASYATYVYEQPSERFSPITDVIRKTLTIRRNRDGYEWIVRHPNVGDLLGEWAAVTKDEGATDQELMAMLDVCRAEDRTDVYGVIAEQGKKGLVPALIAELVSGDNRRMSACLGALITLSNEEQWGDVILLLQKSTDFTVRAGLVLDCSNESMWNKHKEKLLSLFESVQAETFALCMMVFNQEEDNLPSVLYSEHLALLNELAERTSDQLAICAAYVLSAYGGHVQQILTRLARSDDYMVRMNVIRLLGNEDSDDARTMIRQFLRDSDYRCRREAMRALVPPRCPEEKVTLLAMSTDRSAPVRYELTVILKDQIWDEGIPTLISLLRDTRDYSEGHNGYATYKVAHAAVQALIAYPAIQQSNMNEILDLATRELSTNQDMELRYQLIDLISRFRHERVPGILRNCLNNHEEMTGYKHEGFPIRYAGAWGYVYHILELGYEPGDEDLNALSEYALHHDARLAGPCLIAIGCAKLQSRPYIRNMLSRQLSKDRLFLLYAAAAFNDNQTIKDDLKKIFEKDEEDPALMFVEWWQRHQSPSRAEWKAFISKDVASQWIQKLRAMDGIGLSICFLIQRMCGDAIGDTLVVSDVRKHDLAENIPIMNLRTMFGGE